MKRATKIVSKYYRIKMSDEIRHFLKQLPIRNMVESQVGNHIYMGNGELQIGSEYVKMCLKIRLVQKKPVVSISTINGMNMTCHFQIDAWNKVHKFIEESLN
jgi:hypothetical protein